LTVLKRAVAAAIPNASVAIAAHVKPGCRVRLRRADFSVEPLFDGHSSAPRRLCHGVRVSAGPCSGVSCVTRLNHGRNTLDLGSHLSNLIVAANLPHGRPV